MKTYTGGLADVDPSKVFITEDGETKPLLPKRSQLIRNHSPEGFNFGYLGSGPSQLALALLLDHTNDAPLSILLYQDFKCEFVAKFRATWELTANEIQQWIDQKTER